jgi:hypothetical protein
MPKKEYLVKLTDEERAALIALTKKGTIAARKLTRAHILRLADEGQQDAAIDEDFPDDVPAHLRVASPGCPSLPRAVSGGRRALGTTQVSFE